MGADDHNCVKWRKVEEPFIALPPSCDDVPDMVGWRDPYIFEVKGEGDYEEWGILIGSGHKTTGGSVMIYRSKQLSSGGPLTASAGSQAPAWKQLEFTSPDAATAQCTLIHSQPCQRGA